MINPKDFLEIGQKFHGHKCPAMPMGLRVGAAAMNKLGIDRTGDSAWMALVEIGEAHCATCFADGIQVVTGCTLGKGNIKTLGYGKWGLTLINKKEGKAVRVAPKAETMANNKKSKFFTDYRMKGIPPTQVPNEIINPLIESLMNKSQEDILTISEIFEYQWIEKKHTFDSFVCDECGEMTVEQFGRIKGEKHVCIPCLGWGN